MPSGGARAGAAGTAYPQRSDLNATATQPIRAAQGQEYGAHQQQIQAQQQQPLPDFGAPTARPGEPIHSGMNAGPGPNAAQAGLPAMAGPDQSVADHLRAIFSVYPNEDLADLVASLEP